MVAAAPEALTYLAYGTHSPATVFRLEPLDYWDGED
jgi:hypothetical protein